MVKLEKDDDFDYDDDDDFKEEKVAPQNICDYESRRILVWVQDNEYQQMVEESLAFLLPLATIRMVNSEKKATELSEKEEWDTFVVDLTEENVSDSEFVKMANNNPDIMIVVLDYSHLSKDNEQNEIYYEPIRKLFELKSQNANQSETAE
jgi:hypothetical protein